MFGPYYVNTHFLYGDEAAANELLKQIEVAATAPLTFANFIGAAVERQYRTNRIYAQVMNACLAAVQDLEFDLISGGERRDFFFSLQLARLLGKPHLSIFKDGRTVFTDADGRSTDGSEAALAGCRALHVADLVTQASSYLRAWIPALTGLGIQLPHTLAVVDRNQDGAAILAAEGVRLISLAVVSEALFQEALSQGLINEQQMKLIVDYTADPVAFVRAFIAAHPGFLAAEQAKGGKNKERAERLLASGYLR